MLDPFRKQAVDRISSPEELDRLVRVTRPGTWIALIGLVLVLVAVLLWAVLSSVTTTVSGVGFVLPEGGLIEASAPEAGIIERIEVRAGARVAAGDRVARLATADGRELPVTTVEGGIVAEVLRLPGDFVEPGGEVAIVQPERPAVVETFLPQSDAKDAELGDRVWVAPTTASESQYGYAVGRITRIGRFPIPPAGVLSVLESPAGAKLVTDQGPVIRVVVALRPADTPSQVAWTASHGPPYAIDFGTLADVKVVTGEQAPIDYVIG